MDDEKKAGILIVDDNPANLDVLVDYLEDSGFRIFVSTSGERAIQQLEHIKPDIILLDIMMPGMDGFETCRYLKEKKATRHIPIIFMTALSETVDKVRGFYMGASDYITKPFQQEEVLVRLTTHLTIQRQKKELAALNAKFFKTNTELYEANRRLSESNAAKDKFFSVIAADMRSLFFYLLNLSDSLADTASGCDCKNIEELAWSVRDSVRQAYHLMENLLHWSKVQIGVAEFQPRKLNLNEVISKNIILMADMAKQKEIDLSHTVESDMSVYADANMTDTILFNLISNAVKFTHKGGEAEVTARFPDSDEKKFVEIAVSDTGIGIRGSDIPKLFRLNEKFKKLGTAGEKGSGLGLLLCKELVETLRGKIWVESEVGKGTTVRFTLPCTGK
ncbi:MAG: hypothetical protein BWK80_06080 [Desulfobacteraceae bacterium IS3]|nr:MAG: hypothetical protein BWK80_06080 [Desulfobacteraceae bacterium IS3]